ncbi:helix-turn-helix domain-containing protein [Pedobacter nototheniae]|uniref:helix-turn-helix domain-containing protein n=1 Tax=Pedobacter nototheniae TaxID=2488994 RepID=UPI00103F37A7|nr:MULTISPECIES: AraC family transcriptional regulator [Pedobacter]
MRIFETFKPKSKLLSKYISYYYLDVADDRNYFNEYICYPHYNTTVSLYKNHLSKLDKYHSIINYKKEASPIQIYTPLREKPLKVTQYGPVHKIAIVFEPFGINQFLKTGIKINVSSSSPDFQMFDNDFIHQLFQIGDIEEITTLLDQQLLYLLKPIDNVYLEKTLQLFHQEENELNIDEIADQKLGISRKHLSRLFNQYLGVSPQKYRTIVRFRQLMAHKLSLVGKNNYTTLSHQAHYTDQSHFIKACKQLTGLTPMQFFNNGEIVGSEDTFWNFKV